MMSLTEIISAWNRRRLERRKFARRNKATPSYQTWAARHSSPSPHELETLRQRAGPTTSPLISVVMPTYNPRPEHLEAALTSVLDQSYPWLEICIADDASTDPATRAIIERFAAQDCRFKYILREQNGHISAASNSALALATGDFIALLDQDDLLAPHALSVMAEELRQHPDTQIIYSDEDKIDDRGWRSHPHFKPDWNHTLALAQNYVCHLLVIRRQLVHDVGGFRQGMEGAQDHDLLLRCAERARPETIRHVPQVLYHWRVHERSTAKSLGTKPYAQENGCKAVQEHLDRTNVAATVEPDGMFYRVQYLPPEQWPRACVVIPTRDRHELLTQCVATVLERTDYPDVEFCIVDNGTTDPQALAWLKQCATAPRVRVVRDDSPFNYSALNNLAVSGSSSEVICLMNNDIEIKDASWLRQMIKSLLQPGVGIVGCRLFYPDGTLQHAGVIVGLGGTAGHIFRGQKREDPHYMHRPMLRQELSAVTAACLVTRREVYEQLGGLDETFAVAFNDIDYCLRARKAGWKVVYDPYVEMIHHESASRGRDRTPEQRARLSKEKAGLVERHPDFLVHDPAYNPNLTIEHEDASLAPSPRWRATASGFHHG